MRYNLDEYAGKPKEDRLALTLPMIITDLDTLAPVERVRFERLIERGRRRIAERSPQSAD